MAGTILDRAAEIITRYSMVSPSDRVGVGVSGGADSIALLEILHRLQIPITILHLNHQLRGSDSDADEEFVRERAQVLGLACFSERTELPPGNLEQEAREARRNFFLRMKASGAVSRIALGHTRSDQAETVLFRFLRGSGPAGLAGMRFVTPDGFIRPLLELSREELREWAAAEGLSWREDSSNLDLRFARNRLRLRTLPALTRDHNESLERTLINTASIAAAEEEYWDSVVSVIYAEISKRIDLGLLFRAEALAQHPLALQRRLIRKSLQELRGDLRSIELQHVDAIAALLKSSAGHDRVIIPGVDAIRSFNSLLLTRPGLLSAEKRHYRIPLKPGQWVVLPYRAGRIRLEVVTEGSQICANFKGEEYSLSELGFIDQSVLAAGDLQVRNWEPGDEIRRTGHENPEKLKYLFQEQRVLLWERRHWPVVLNGDEIVWSRRFGCAARVQTGRDGPDTCWIVHQAIE